MVTGLVLQHRCLQIVNCNTKVNNMRCAVRASPAPSCREAEHFTAHGSWHTVTWRAFGCAGRIEGSVRRVPLTVPHVPQGIHIRNTTRKGQVALKILMSSHYEPLAKKRYLCVCVCYLCVCVCVGGWMSGRVGRETRNAGCAFPGKQGP